jgi:hypothetical protein
MSVRERISEQDQERLRKVYPLLEFDFSNPLCAIARYGDQSFGLDDNYSLREQKLTEWHQQIATETRLRVLYPDLWISIYEGIHGYAVSVWVKRSTVTGAWRDAEAFGQTGMLYLDDPALHPTLVRYQEQAALAKQDGWFLCSGHDRAEKREDGMWFHFAGKYCKQYGDEHPGKHAAARNENYR